MTVAQARQSRVHEDPGAPNLASTSEQLFSGGILLPQLPSIPPNLSIAQFRYKSYAGRNHSSATIARARRSVPTGEQPLVYQTILCGTDEDFDVVRERSASPPHSTRSIATVALAQSPRPFEVIGRNPSLHAPQHTIQPPQLYAGSQSAMPLHLSRPAPLPLGSAWPSGGGSDVMGEGAMHLYPSSPGNQLLLLLHLRSHS